MRVAEDTPLQAGCAARDITPAPDMPLWGYSDALRTGKTKLDPLYAKAVVFCCGDSRVAVVTMDTGRVPRREVCTRIRSAAAAAGVNDVVLTATHTHSAPVMEVPGMPYEQDMEQSIGECIAEAASTMMPVRLAVGRATVDIAHNRRLIRDGECYMMWRNAERKATSPLDKEAGVIRLDRADGTPLATLVHYACHPVIFGPDSQQYSADWPGEMCRRVKEATGGECLFLQGGCGDINPYMDKTPIAEGAVEIMREEGAKAAGAVLAVWKGLAPEAEASSSLGFHRERMETALRWDVEDEVQAKLLREHYGPAYDMYLKPFQADPTLPLSALLINGRLGLAFVPGEFFVRFQQDLKHHSPIADTFLCGYADEFHAYFPTIKDAVIGGYGGAVATYVAIGAGERMTTRAAVLLATLSGGMDAATEAGLEVREL